MMVNIGVGCADMEMVMSGAHMPCAMCRSACMGMQEAFKITDIHCVMGLTQ